jgi:hypothetical protein
MSGYLQLCSLVVTALLGFIPAMASVFSLAVAAPEPPVVAPEPEKVTRTLQWTGSEHVFELSNTRGDVRIVAENRSDVSVVATRTVEREGRNGAPTPGMDFKQESGRLLVCGDNTHCGCHVSWPEGNRERSDDRARVRVDFEVRVPRAATLDVCAVNGGTVRVEGTEGPFTLSNVNGNLNMVRVRGTGSAHTVNGDVEATFAAQPGGPADFKTVNGRVDVTLPASLAADLRLKTLNGQLYTDFETTPLAATPVQERRNGRFVYHIDRAAAVRVGKGGPALSFETLNGDVRVRRQR